MPSDPAVRRGLVVHNISELLTALDLQDRRELQEVLDERAELDVRIDWDDVADTAGLTIIVSWRGVTLAYPFAVDELWEVVDELEDEVTQELEEEARRELDGTESDNGDDDIRIEQEERS